MTSDNIPDFVGAAIVRLEVCAGIFRMVGLAIGKEIRYVVCTIGSIVRYAGWFDTECVNKQYRIALATTVFYMTTGKPGIYGFPGCLPIKNVRALAALDSNEWNDIVILGLNVLNHMTYKIDRDNRTFEWLESLTSNVPGSERSKFNHLIWNGSYLLADE